MKAVHFESLERTSIDVDPCCPPPPVSHSNLEPHTERQSEWPSPSLTNELPEPFRTPFISTFLHTHRLPFLPNNSSLWWQRSTPTALHWLCVCVCVCVCACVCVCVCLRVCWTQYRQRVALNMCFCLSIGCILVVGSVVLCFMLKLQREIDFYVGSD